MIRLYRTVTFVVYKYYLNKGDSSPFYAVQWIMSTMLMFHVLQVYFIVVSFGNGAFSEWLMANMEMRIYIVYLFFFIWMIVKYFLLPQKKIENIIFYSKINYDNNKYYVLFYIFGNILFLYILAILISRTPELSPSLIGFNTI